MRSLMVWARVESAPAEAARPPPPRPPRPPPPRPAAPNDSPGRSTQTSELPRPRPPPPAKPPAAPPRPAFACCCASSARIRPSAAVSVPALRSESKTVATRFAATMLSRSCDGVSGVGATGAGRRLKVQVTRCSPFALGPVSDCTVSPIAFWITIDACPVPPPVTRYSIWAPYGALCPRKIDALTGGLSLEDLFTVLVGGLRLEHRQARRGVRTRQLRHRVDVHDPDAAPVRRRNQFAIPRLDLQVVHGHRRQAGHEALPGATPIEGDVGADIGADDTARSDWPDPRESRGRNPRRPTAGC